MSSYLEKTNDRRDLGLRINGLGLRFPDIVRDSK